MQDGRTEQRPVGLTVVGRGGDRTGVGRLRRGGLLLLLGGGHYAATRAGFGGRVIKVERRGGRGDRGHGQYHDDGVLPCFLHMHYGSNRRPDPVIAAGITSSRDDRSRRRFVDDTLGTAERSATEVATVAVGGGGAAAAAAGAATAAGLVVLVVGHIGVATVMTSKATWTELGPQPTDGWPLLIGLRRRLQ